METFIIGCTHYGHSNICRGTSSWKSGWRNFKTLEEMNRTIVDNINKVVGTNDTLYHLGDWSFGGYDNIKEFRYKINCSNIILILGNHDKNIKQDKNNELKKLFTEVVAYKEISINRQFICMSHYPMRSWHDIQRNSWMLHSHTHGSLADDKSILSIDVGVDTEWFREDGDLYMTTNYNKSYSVINNQRIECVYEPTNDIIHPRFHPYTFDELSTIMNWKKKHRQAIDHHG